VKHRRNLVGTAEAVLTDEAHEFGAILVLALLDGLGRHAARIRALLLSIVVGGGGNGCVCHRTHPFLGILTKFFPLLRSET
jgi:hypothetical protein